MTQELLAKIRDEISMEWHNSTSMWMTAPNHTFRSRELYFGFCAAKDWIQDTCDILIAHRKRDFSRTPIQADLELLGVMQAVFVQQDAIKELDQSLGITLDAAAEDSSVWKDIRDLRNLIVGHPTKQGSKKTGVKRCINRGLPKSYKEISVMVYSDTSAKVEVIQLGQMMDAYSKCAACHLEKLHKRLSEQVSEFK